MLLRQKETGKRIKSAGFAVTGFVLVIVIFVIIGIRKQNMQTKVSDLDDSLQKVLDAKKLILGLDASYPPMGFKDESGKIVGFDIDVAERVCDKLGITLVKKPIRWEKKEEELNSGAIDCIWNGMSMTPERAKSMTLSEPYLKNSLIFVVPENSTIKGLRDLKGKKVGVQAGSTVVEALLASDTSRDISAVEFEDNMMLVEQLKKGTVDVILIDSIAAYYFIFSSKERYYVLSDSLSEEECAIGFRKGDNKLRNKVQELLDEMKADGSLGKISKKWFGTDITIVR